MKKRYILGATLFSVIAGLTHYMCNIDAAPWGIEPNLKVSDSLSTDETIMAMAKEGKVKNISLTCGYKDNLVRIIIELNGDPTVINDEKVWYFQHGPCTEHYFKANFMLNKVEWSGFLKDDVTYGESLIIIKSEIKGHLAKAQAYARDKVNYRKGWKIKG